MSFPLNLSFALKHGKSLIQPTDVSALPERIRYAFAKNYESSKVDMTGAPLRQYFGSKQGRRALDEWK
jgi:hypothetical protein